MLVVKIFFNDGGDAGAGAVGADRHCNDEEKNADSILLQIHYHFINFSVLVYESLLTKHQIQFAEFLLLHFHSFGSSCTFQHFEIYGIYCFL